LWGNRTGGRRQAIGADLGQPDREAAQRLRNVQRVARGELPLWAVSEVTDLLD
jgi:hypothetical protein